MKIQNISKRMYQYTTLDDLCRLVNINLYPGETKDIPENIAKIWLKTGECRRAGAKHKGKKHGKS